ncbi:uncharacterized protein HD556DRAFT_1306883 [Suillus plorans]|uniref:Uncharacterized protein n=1 Tax=Suillus plorans TaxID=116603 RepID=A0A9P7ATZ5_9AGAM|nr:uncharacterized protein HD556DRAFT_1306883 [Suillus plorans]KAG1796691.1 hypothetical protein HD556DRAFT_1306883 [Suillus plorans]
MYHQDLTKELKEIDDQKIWCAGNVVWSLHPNDKAEARLMGEVWPYFHFCAAYTMLCLSSATAAPSQYLSTYTHVIPPDPSIDMHFRNGCSVVVIKTEGIHCAICNMSSIIFNFVLLTFTFNSMDASSSSSVQKVLGYYV